MDVKGRDLKQGLPRKVVVTSEEIREALQEPIRAIVEAVKATLEATPPELAADLVDSGIVMAGGGSLLRGLDRVIAEEINLPVRVAEDPLTAVARGTGVFLEKLGELRSRSTRPRTSPIYSRASWCGRAGRARNSPLRSVRCTRPPCLAETPTACSGDTSRRRGEAREPRGIAG